MIGTGEYELATASVGLVDRSERAKVEVRGGDAGDFLQGQLTNDVEALSPGQGCYAAILTHKGKLRADLRVLRLEDAFWLDSEAIAGRVVLHMLQTYSLGREVRWKDVTSERAILSLLGPESRSPLDVQPPPDEHAFVVGEHGLYVSTHLGVDVICDAAESDAVAEELGVERVSEEIAECLRIESGRPRLGLDMGSDTIPEEAALNERAVSFTKGCYVGQETVARLHYRGKPNRRLRGLRLAEPAARGDRIRLGEREVGTIGSSCVSPRFGPIALAVVRREAPPGSIVTVGDGAEAEIIELPFASLQPPVPGPQGSDPGAEPSSLRTED